MNQMKCSVSMTSLEFPQKNPRTPEGQQKKPWHGGRQCGSLNSKKPRRTLDKKMWRRSWGSNNDDSGQEEFWRICQQSVQELVEANSDEQGLRHFLEDYGNICGWLNSMQIERGRFVDAIKLSELAQGMAAKHHWRIEVNETAKCLLQKHPKLKEEFQWRLKHLNSQWDALEKILSRQQDHSLDITPVNTPNIEGKDCDLDWVRDWLRKKENELQPLDFRTEWTPELLDQEIRRYKAIQQEIEEKASAIHAVLRQQQQQCQSRGQLNNSEGNNSKENSKRSRLETRWFQLRLRVLEWIQHLTGIAERQKNLKKGRRADNFYSASTWDSDGDNNEPLRKCPKFDEGDDSNTISVQSTATNERIVPRNLSTEIENLIYPSEEPSNYCDEVAEQKSIDLVVPSPSQSPYMVRENKGEETASNQQDINSSIISNHRERQFGEQVVPGPSRHNHHHHYQQVLLLNQQQLQGILQHGRIRRREKGELYSNNVLSVTLDEVDCDMGQSHDSENVFSQSEPQFPNSVVEFTFDGSQCVGKRKLSNGSPSGSPPLTSSAQQVVPRNISIYYFTHSDTEPEPHHSQQGNNPSRGNRHHHQSSSTKSPQHSRRAFNRVQCEKSAILPQTNACKLANSSSGTCTCIPTTANASTSGGNCGTVSTSSRKGANRHHHVCQKSRLFLDFDQEFEDDITSLKSYDEISFGSFDLDLDEDLEGEAGVANPLATPSSSSSSATEGGGGLGDHQQLESSLNHLKLNQSGQDEQSHSIMDIEGNLFLSTEEGEGEMVVSQQLDNSFNGNCNGKGKNCATASNNNQNKPVVRLDEIEELVQKAELLVQKTTRSRGVECVDLPDEVLGSSEDDDEQEDDGNMLMLPQKHCGDQLHHHVHHYHHHSHQQNSNIQQQKNVMMISAHLPSANSSNGFARCCGNIGGCGEIEKGTSGSLTTANNGISNGHGSQELLHSPSSPQKFSGFYMRKCSVSSGVSSSSFSSAQHQKFVKSVKAASTTLATSLSSWSTTVASAPSTDNCGFVQQLNCCNNSSSTQPYNINQTMMTDENNGTPKGINSIVGSPENINVSCGGGESGSTSAAGGSNNNGVVAASFNKTSKKNARIRQWIRAHNSEIVVNQKSTSSCDASAESASDSEYSSSDSEHPPSSDDPTTVSTSTFLHQTHAAIVEANAKALSSCSSSNNIFGSGILPCCTGAATSPGSVKASSHHYRSPLASSSDVGNLTLTPSCSGTIVAGQLGTVPLRSKKRLSYIKQRPKSFTDTLDASSPNNSAINGGPSVNSSGRASWLRTSPSYFVSDSAINLLGNRSNSCSEGSGSSSGGEVACSPGNSNAESPSHPKKKGSSRYKRRSQKWKRKVSQNEDTVVAVDESKEPRSSILRSSSFTESASGPVAGEKSQSPNGADRSSATTSSPKPNFFISGSVSSRQPFNRLNSDNGSSLNTEELNTNDQADWDSYQEKYLSEPYSEEPYDPDGTLKLLAFGEDYGQYLDRAESESSSMLSGFEPSDSRKRRPLTLANRGEMADSDSDREELNYLLRQSNSQLRFIDGLFRGLLAKAENSGENPAKYAEMEATCDENISSLKLVLSNIKETENLPFEIDVNSIEAVLEKWHILREKIRQAANLHHIQEKMGGLKTDISNVQSLFCTCKQFDITDMDSLRAKIRSIEDVLLNELPTRKQQLQQLNDASLKTQVLLDDQDTVGLIKRQLNELYVLYEDNFQLGTFLLEKMRYLEDAWEQFEKEKQEFQKSVSVSNLRAKLRKEFSSSASTDSGHGTDFSHDSSISDSDMEFQERHKKLVALKERAKKVKAFLPPGSPVLDMLDQSVEEAEKDLTSLKGDIPPTETIDLKSLYPKKKPFIYSRRNSGQRSPKSKLLSPPLSRKVERKWTVVRRMVMFNMALMGFFLAAAYLLNPKCCEFSNTFCFSLVPHLTHETLPPI